MRIRLLGRPEVRGEDGNLGEVRGYQAWAVLALVALSKRPLSRRDIAFRLFPDVDDPLGALRWCLAALRRAIGPGCLTGDPVELNMPANASVDVWNLDHEDFQIEEAGELLEGIDVQASLEFSTWLLIERERISAAIYERTRQEALRALSARNYDRAIRTAELSISRRPLDEAGHILLVRGLVLAGHTEAAVAHVEATERAFLAELGEKPSAALRSAARPSIASAPQGVSQNTVIEALIKSGTAALSAGAVDAGLDCLRRAAEGAQDAGERHLQAKALMELGTALVHSIRGFDDEGAILLRQAVDLAAQCGSARIASSGLRELGYVEALAGRRPSAERLLRQALDCSHRDQSDLAGIHAVIGFNLIDWGRCDEGLNHYEQALELARTARNKRREIWSLGLGGWGQLAAGRTETAIQWLESCIDHCDEARWLAFRPWPIAILAEAKLKLDSNKAVPNCGVEEAFALSCQLGDPCWEAATARAMGLAFKAAGDFELAAIWLGRARERCTSVSDLYAALLVNIVSDQMRLSEVVGDSLQAKNIARELLSLASTTHADAHLREALAVIGVRTEF